MPQEWQAPYNWFEKSHIGTTYFWVTAAVNFHWSSAVLTLLIG